MRDVIYGQPIRRSFFQNIQLLFSAFLVRLSTVPEASINVSGRGEEEAAVVHHQTRMGDDGRGQGGGCHGRNFKLRSRSPWRCRLRAASGSQRQSK